MAQEVLREGSARARDFATVTFVWGGTPQSDELRWARPVIDQYDLTNHQIPCDDLFFDRAAEASLYRNEPHFGIFTHPMFLAQTGAEFLREAELVRFGSSQRFGAFTSYLAFEFWLRAVTALWRDHSRGQGRPGDPAGQSVGTQAAILRALVS